MNSTACTTLGVLAFALLLGVVGPQLQEAQDSHTATIEAAMQAERQQLARTRFEAAAQAMCGENGAWRELADGAVQCYTHRGHPTRRVSL